MSPVLGVWALGCLPWFHPLEPCDTGDWFAPGGHFGRLHGDLSGRGHHAAQPRLHSHAPGPEPRAPGSRAHYLCLCKCDPHLMARAPTLRKQGDKLYNIVWRREG